MTQLILIALVGVLIGFSVASILFTVFSVSGTLRIDHSDPGTDRYRIEIKRLDALDGKRFVILKVDNHADLSQK